MRIMRTLTAALIGSVLAATLSVAVPHTAQATSRTMTAGDVLAAIDRVDARSGSLVADAAPSITDRDSAAQTASVDIPINPTHGVTLKAKDGQRLTVGLPGARQSGRGIKTRRGVVMYVGSGGSTNAVIPTIDQGVQLLTTISRRTAPTQYSYPMSLPRGGWVEVAPGGIAGAVFRADGTLLSLISQPWARDARGGVVQTRFTTNGHTLTQVVDHRAKGVSYPVVADPIILPAWAIWNLSLCLGGGLWGYLSGGGNSFDERLYQAAIGCLGLTTARSLFRR